MKIFDDEKFFWAIIAVLVFMMVAQFVRAFMYFVVL